MATTFSSAVATQDGAGNIVSLLLSGTSDECPGGTLTIQISDADTGELLASGNAPYDGANWTKTLTVPDDVAADQVACKQKLQVTLSCRQNGVTTPLDISPDTAEVDCDGSSRCTIDIGTATGVPSPGPSGLDQLTVVGTATGCSSVHVVATPIGHPSAAPISVDATVNNGQWTAVFVSGAPGVGTGLKAFDCKGSADVTASCKGSRDCSTTTRVRLDCGGGTDCTANVEIDITRANGRHLRTSNPTCETAPSGDYNLLVVGPAGSTITVISWTQSSSVDSGPTILQDAAGNNITSNPLTVTIDYSVAAAVNFTFTALVRDEHGCLGTASATFSCGGAPDPKAPVDCQVSEWSNFGPCINGQQTRTRTVVTQPRNGGRPCPALTETRRCPPVAVDCEVSAFSNWSPCVNGIQRRTRQVVTQPQNGGRPCPALEETRRCGGASAVCDFCCIWNWVNIGLFIATALLIFITFCFLLSATAVAAITAFMTGGGTFAAIGPALITLDIVMLSICLGLLIVGLISWILWLVFCLANNPNACDMLWTLITVLATITVLSAVIGAIVWAISEYACLAAAIIDVGWFGMLGAISTLIYAAMGCHHD